MHKPSISVYLLFSMLMAVPMEGHSSESIENIVIGYRNDAYPLSFTNENDKADGYSVDICKSVVQEIERNSGGRLQVKWVELNSENRIEAVENHTVDLECGATTITLERKKRVDFSPMIMATGTRILVSKSSKIENLDDLKNVIVGVSDGTTSSSTVRSKIKEQNLRSYMHYVDSHGMAIPLLDSGVIDAYVSDEIILLGVKHKNKNGENYEIRGQFESYEPYAIVIPKNRDQLRWNVDSAITDLFRSGVIEEIYRKWFDELDYPLNEILLHAFIIQSWPIGE